VHWLAARGVPLSLVCVWGHSLGSGVAAQLAARLQRASTPLHSLVLEAPFYSARAAAITFPLTQVLRAIPMGMPLLCRSFKFGFRTADILPELSLPMLIFHGTSDSTVPIQHSRKLMRAMDDAKNTHARFVTLPKCDHLHALFQPAILAILAQFFKR